MINLEKVKKFYQQVEFFGKFDFESLAAEFQNHDVFANPPQFHKIVLPFLGQVELGLVAIQKSWPLKVAIDDGKYNYESKVSFLAKETETLREAGYEMFSRGPFAGHCELSCEQSSHSNLFGHPASYSGRDHWQLRSSAEFVTKKLPELLKNAISRFYPAELHQFPFDESQYVEVFVKDSTKVGGITVASIAANAMDAWNEGAEKILSRERGNANVSGYIKAGGIMFVLPAFGKNYVAFEYLK